MYYEVTKQPTHNRKTDRKIVLKAIDGTKPKNAFGIIDPRLLTGENGLHAIMNTENCHWYLKYEHGALPESLRGKTWTKFTTLMVEVHRHFNARNIEVVEVID